MLGAVARMLIWLCLGEALMRIGLVPVPSPVTGLLLLYLDLLYHGRLPDDLGRLADRMLALFGLMFVPAGVGVIAQADVLRTEAVPIVAAILGGTFANLLAVFVTLNLLRSWRRRQQGGLVGGTLRKVDRHA